MEPVTSKDPVTRVLPLLLAAFFSMVMVLTPSGPALAQTDQDETAADDGQPAPETAQDEAGLDDLRPVPPPPYTVETLEAFIDGVVMTAMDDHKIPGVTVAVVNRGATLLLKGYGFADVPAREPVDPGRHLFRVASITKTFTATVIMQLVEAGQIDLETNIRTYLDDLAFDDSKGTITVGNLLSHTAGFEDRLLGYYGIGGAQTMPGRPTAEQLEALAPRQVRAPGIVTSYSNYSYALLGEIIARVTGTDYADAVHERILAPLGMAQASLRFRYTDPAQDDPRTAALRADAAKSHVWSAGWYETQTFGQALKSQAAAGQLSASAGAMARYMRMHLNGGSLDGVTILAPDTMALMRMELFRNAPVSQANAHGFWLETVEGHTAYGHGGSINNFLSMMTFFPELGLGIFVSTNAADGSELRDLPERIVRRFSPGPEKTIPAPPAGFVDRAERYTGTYHSTRRNDTALDRLAVLAQPALEVRVTEDGYLVTSIGSSSRRYVEVDEVKGLFAHVKDGSQIQFSPEPKAKWAYLSSGAAAYERLGPFSSADALMAGLGVAGLAALSTLLAAGLRWNKGTPPPRTIGQRIAQWVLMLTGIAWLVTLGTFAAGFGELAESETLIYGAFPTPMIAVMLICALVTAGLSVLSLLMLLAVWLGKEGWPMGWRLRYTGVVLVFAYGVWVLYDWKVLSYHAETIRTALSL